ncbi:MAG: hypothetical protein HYZ93_06470 [Candidatus Omnitrophica bacterium]|nr:hypothetical protein [Candidatus Omnitrophota bacterium]
MVAGPGPFCFFCGNPLSKGKAQEEYACPACRALFKAETDAGGCVVQMRVVECGTPDCCRRQRSAGVRPHGV